MIIKSQFTSKTNWLNAIAFLLALLAFPQFIAVIPVSWLPYIGLVMAILNYILRNFFTSQPTTQFAAEQNPSQG